MTAPGVPRTAVDALVRVVADLNGTDAVSLSDNEWAMDVVIRMRDEGYEIVPEHMIREAEAAASGLDVGRLAEVLRNATQETFGPLTDEFWHKQAEALAAEYARLAAQEEGA